jgi:hypothetical protein
VVLGFHIRSGSNGYNYLTDLRDVEILAPAICLSFGVTLWLQWLHTAGLSLSPGGQPSDLAHVIRNGLLAFPLALVAVIVSAWWAERWKLTASTPWALLRQAALIAIVFAVLLALAAGPQILLDRVLDGSARPPAAHGQPRAAAPDGAGGVLLLTLEGLRKGLLAYIAAWPLAFLTLILLPAQSNAGCAGVENARSPARIIPGKWIMPTGIALAMLGVGVFALGVAAGNTPHWNERLGHAPMVTDVPIGVSAGADDMRVTVHTAKWVRQSPQAQRVDPTVVEAKFTAEPDRVYVDIALENLGPALRNIGRAEFRLAAKDGRSWAPLANDFPDLLLTPEEKLNTRLIFEIPPQAAQLEITVPGAAPIAIADDSLGGVFAALCRALPRPWKG